VWCCLGGRWIALVVLKKIDGLHWRSEVSLLAKHCFSSEIV